MVALALVPFIVMTRLPMRHIAAVGALVCGLWLAGFAALLLDNGVAPDIMVKAMIAIFIAAIVLIPAGYFSLPEHIVPILVGASFATVIHLAVGVYQEISYARSDFPFLGFYQNPSFSSVAGMSEDYALWIKRPFGLFPEPSAMTASLGPWLIVIAGVLLNYRLRAPIRPATRVLLLVALACGVTLIFRARSGYAPLWAASLFPLLMLSPVIRGRAQKTRSPRLFFLLVGGIAVAVLFFVFAREQVGSSDVDENSSWKARQQSIVIALTAPSRGLDTFLFGYGPGQAATYLIGTETADLLPKWYQSSSVEQVVTIWSVLGTLYMEMGLIGFALIVALLTAIGRAIARSSARMLGVSTLAAWLAGVTVTTSYFPLSPIWLCLALLLAWDRVFVPVAVEVPARVPVLTALPRIVPGRRYRRVATGVLS